MTERLEHPINNKLLKRYTGQYLVVGCAESQGWRSTMEDQMEIDIAQNVDEESFFGVYDGHGGDDASRYICEHLGEELRVKTEELDKNDEIIDIFHAVDEKFRKKTRNPFVGTTASCVIVKPNLDKSNDSYSLVIAHVGDSRVIVLNQDNKIVFSTTDHKPTSKVEKKRIKHAGGNVIRKRVDGYLAMSRAMGDFNFKQDESMDWTDQKVICVPDIARLNVQTNYKLILCCDGFFENGQTNQDLVDFILDRMKKYSNDLAKVAADAISNSMDNKSHDNHSIIIANFGISEHFEEKTRKKQKDLEFVCGQFQPTQYDRKFTSAYLRDLTRNGIDLRKFFVPDEKLPDGKTRLEHVTQWFKGSQESKFLQLLAQTQDSPAPYYYDGQDPTYQVEEEEEVSETDIEDTFVESKSKSKSKIKTKSKGKVKSKTKTKNKNKTKSKVETKTETDTKSENENKSEIKSESKGESKSETKGETKVKNKIKIEIETDREIKIDSSESNELTTIDVPLFTRKRTRSISKLEEKEQEKEERPKKKAKKQKESV